MAISIAGAGDGDPMVEMNTTPLIDVMMVLLILFIITLPLMTNITKLDLPQDPSSDAVKREVIHLAIDFDGALVWNGVVVDGVEQLERYFRVEAARGVQPELHVRPDKRARYDRVAQVLASAQRNGLKHIGIVGGD
jgi:biopolymer transport protein ExbD